MTAPSILRAAIKHMEDRAKTYDKPEGERSMGATVDAFSAVTGVSMTEEQGWLFMALLKAVRSQQGEYKADNYEDGAAYFARAGESAMRDRLAGKPKQSQLDVIAEKMKQAGYAFSGDFKSGGFTGQGCLSSSPSGGVMIRCVGCTESNCMC